jgi:glycerol-3-phosphate O-acyltransferase
LRNFIKQLGVHNLVHTNEAGLLEFDERLQALDEEAGRILSGDINQTILRITRPTAAIAVDADAETEKEANKE